MFFNKIIKSNNIVNLYNRLVNLNTSQINDLRSITHQWLTNKPFKKDYIFYNHNYDVWFIQLSQYEFTWMHPNSVYICLNGVNQVIKTRGYDKPTTHTLYLGRPEIVTDDEVHKVSNINKKKTLILEIKPFK